MAIVQKQQQTISMSPEHIMGKAVLKMSLQELRHFVQSQIAENPAICMEEEDYCPICGSALLGDGCPSCGAEDSISVDLARKGTDDWEDALWTSATESDDEYYEPFARVASPMMLSEHLHEQVRLNIPGDKLAIADHLIECLDPDGYLTEPMIDIATRLGLSVPQVEEVLALVQSLDPPGVGARNLRECLLLQLAQLDDAQEKDLALLVIRDHWDALEKMKLEKIAENLGIDPREMVKVVSFIRERLTPYPAAMFRDPWEKLAPRQVCETSPDIVVRQGDYGLEAEVIDSFYGRLSIDAIYSSLSRTAGRRSSASDLEHVKDCISKAKSLMDALEFRKSTLRKIADELLVRQADFFMDGPTALKPMTRKELAGRIGVHESTVSRATQDKSIRLPTGESMPVDVLFDSALPIKELIREMTVQRLSDGEIAEKLAKKGIKIARRTVAKYRSQMRLLPVELRVA